MKLCMSKTSMLCRTTCQELTVDFSAIRVYSPRTMTKASESDRFQTKLQSFGSYEKAARFLYTKGVEVSGSYLCMLVRKTRSPSVTMAKEIAMALNLRLSDVTSR